MKVVRSIMPKTKRGWTLYLSFLFEFCTLDSSFFTIPTVFSIMLLYLDKNL